MHTSMGWNHASTDRRELLQLRAHHLGKQLAPPRAQKYFRSSAVVVVEAFLPWGTAQGWLWAAQGGSCTGDSRLRERAGDWGWNWRCSKAKEGLGVEDV